MRATIFFFLLILPLSAFAALTAAQKKAVQQRTENLITLLNQLGPKINALPSATPPSLSANIFQLVGIGADAGYTSISFGTLGALDSPREATILVKNTTGRPANFFGIRGLSVPFSFKGGVYPGVGGTCGQIISAPSCTLVLQYAPSANDAGVTIGDVIRHTNQIYFDATPEGADLDEPSNPFGLFGYRRGEQGEADPTTELVAELFKQPQAVLPGETSTFSIRVGLKSGDTRPVYFRDVAVSGVQVPFAVEKNECVEQAVSTEQCFIRVLFKPVSAGTFKQDFSLSVDIGGSTKKQFSVSVSATALLPQDQISASKNVLVVYNEAWGESVEAKNYYIENRSGFAQANTLGVQYLVSPPCSSLSCLSQAIELPPYSKLKEQVLDPIIAWLRAHSVQDIQYIVLMRGLPTRPDEVTRTQLGIIDGLQNMIRKEVAQTLSEEVFVSSVDMGSLSATKAYIDKLQAVYALMPVKSPVISARGTSKSGTTYYFSDAYAPNFETNSIPAKAYADALKAANPSATIVHKGFRDVALTSAINVAGLFHRGIYGYGWNKEYATDGTIQLSGNSGWWIAETAESFNGLWLTNGEQGSFISWFAPNAYGGSNYSNTPVAAVSHVFEPGSRGYNGPYLFTCWESGKPFAYCAWKSTDSPFALQAVGDPLVTR